MFRYKLLASVAKIDPHFRYKYSKTSCAVVATQIYFSPWILGVRVAVIPPNVRSRAAAPEDLAQSRFPMIGLA